MKRIKVSGVYYVQGSLDDRRCAARLERMLQHIDTDSVTEASFRSTWPGTFTETS